MSEVQSRPVARSRGTGRGGRAGGFSTRGGGGRISSRNSATNGDSKHDTESSLPTVDDEGDVGELKKQYGGKVSLIKEMFPDWSEVDILYALQETDGDESVTVTRIADGTISQWGEVSKQKKDRTRAKSKNDTFTTTTGDTVTARPSRGGRGTEGTRGGRGRATDRGGRGGTRGKSAHATTNGARPKDNAQLSVPTEEATEWDSAKPADDSAGHNDANNAWETTTSTETAPAPAVAAAAAAAAPKSAAAPAVKTWASMLRQSTASKPTPKPKEPPAPKPAEPAIEPLPPAETVVPEPEPIIPAVPEPVPEPVKETVEAPNIIVPEIALPPSKDQLTETNLERVADDSNPPDTETALSEAADSWDPRAAGVSATATPLSAAQQQHQLARAASGYATSAIKATERTSTRTPSYQRRLLDQEEAVRMPGNREQVERTALQFGAFSLQGPEDEDIDGDREEPETRAQPPADSPVAHPRTSLPPPQPAPVPEAFQKPVPTAPASSQPVASTSVPPGFSADAHAAAPAPAVPSQPAAAAQGAQTGAQNQQQFARFGQPAQDQTSFPGGKQFDSFGQQQPAATQNQFEGGFQNQQPPSQAQSQNQQQPGGAFSSAPSDYSTYYTADQNRNAYNNYYQNFGQQHGAQGQQDGASQGQQRAFSGYNAQDNLSQYPQSAGHRFGAGSANAAAADAQNSGSNTPNPTTTTQTQQPASQTTQSHGQQQPHDYPYNHPYYNNPYYSAYMGGGYGQGAYNQGGYGPYGKGGLGYGQPNQFGISPQGPHGYGSSPAGGFAQSSLHRGDSGAASGLSDYARVSSGQSSAQQGLGGSSFGGIHDTFGRGGSSYPSQAGQGYNANASQTGSGPSGGDDLKPFGDKAGSGPSPSLANAARPGSATNNAPSQGGLPPPQSGQQSGLGGMGGYGGYPSHVPGQGLHSNQSGYGMSAGAGQGHQNNYGGYGGQGFGGSYYGNQQQQQRGWGNNYGHH